MPHLLSLPTLTSDDVEILERQSLYRGFFQITGYRFRHRLFAGGWSDTLTREIFQRPDAVVVLPYDPQADAVILIEQLRIGALRPGRSPWLLELVAGMIDKDETAAQVAMREAREEAGLEVTSVRHMLSYFSSPGGTNERIHLYLALVDSRHAGGIHGLPEEGEDIRVHVVPRAEVMAALEDGRLDNAATLIGLQWLALHLDDIRQGAVS